MRVVRWEDNRRVPPGIVSILAALRLDEPNYEPLRTLGTEQWKKALFFCDRSRLTLLAARLLEGRVPGWVSERFEQNRSDHREHRRRLKAEFLRLCDRFCVSDMDFLVLKGFAQQSGYSADPGDRVQYDIDLYSPPECLAALQRCLESLGYEPIAGAGERPVDHLPAMVRKTGWQWRGNYFDPEIPPSVDLHFRFWDEETEGLRAPGVEQFWLRRIVRSIDGHSVPVLDSVDALGYAALHLLRHLLRSSLTPQHVYELAYFLHNRASDTAFWEGWQRLHAPELRRLQAISFALAASWFGCRLPAVAQEEISRLPDPAQLWFEHCAAAPVESLSHPNKDELWLHLSLLEGTAAKVRVLRRRLLPRRLPGPVDAVYVPEAEQTWGTRGAATLRYARYAATRVVHHLRALPLVILHGLRWRRKVQPRWGDTATLLGAASIYNLGVFVFVLLYNLYLLDTGHRENLLGLVAGAGTVGSLIGAWPAARMAGRLGLGRSLMIGFVGMAVVSALRSLLPGNVALTVSAFAGGVFASVWFVLFAPAVSSLSGRQEGAVRFSWFVASGIGMGVIAGLIGGWLPGWLHASFGLANPAEAKRFALLCASALMALAAWPASRIRFEPETSARQESRPGGPFLTRYFVALGVWYLAIGLFNPFFTAYFSRALHSSEAQIGLTFAAAQLVQAGAVMLAPRITRTLGLVRGVHTLQLAAAAAFAMLAPGPPLLAAAGLYAACMSFQAMCEPGVFSLLMGRVEASQRSRAAATNFVVLFSAQTVAAMFAGAAITRLGYSWVLGLSALLAVVAAILLGTLLRITAEEKTRPTLQDEDLLSGRQNWKQAPWPAEDVTHMSPP